MTYQEMMENAKLSMVVGAFSVANTLPVRFVMEEHVKTRYRDRAQKVLVILRSEIIKSGRRSA